MGYIRRGSVSTYNKTTGMMRVLFQDTGVTTAELPVYSPFGCTPDFRSGQQVIVLSINNTESVVLGALKGEETIDSTDINWIKRMPEIERRLTAVEKKV